jgi:hypothetical protein
VEDGNNHRVHQRLMYVLLSCPAGPPQGKSFEVLADEAFRLIPPSKRPEPRLGMGRTS